MTKPTSILVTDTHLDKDNINRVLNVLFQSVDLAVELGVKKIDFLGDAFTNRTGQGLMVLLAMDYWIGYAKAKGVDIYAISGNHDKTDQESLDSYLDVFKSHSNFHLFRKETITIDTNNMAHCYLPYFKENGSYPKRLLKLIGKLKKSSFKKAYLYTHIAVDGVVNNDGSKVKNGLKKELFGIFHKVFVGHYHNTSKIGDNIYYIGSSLPHNFGEDNEKGFTILYSDGSHELFLSNFDKFIPLKIDLGITTKKQIEALKERYKDSNNNVRIVFTGTKEQLESININELREVGIDVKKTTTDATRAIEAAANGEVIEFDKKEIMKGFGEFCRNNDVPNTKRTVGLKLLTNV